MNWGKPHCSGTVGHPIQGLSSARTGHTYNVNVTTMKAHPTNTKRLRSLVDRGANGGIAGREMRVISWTDRYVDLSGIDDHTLRAVRIGTFGATVRTHRGDRILVWNQLAHMPDGKSIVAALQMEAGGCAVFEKPPQVTGKIPHIRTPDGCKIPISIRNGLPYIELRPFTDKEWDELPRVDMTNDNEWDPTVHDYQVPHDWYETQEQFSADKRDSMFTDEGEIKESIITDEPIDEGIREEDDNDPSYIDRQMIQAYLHRIIKDECDDVFCCMDDGRQLHEHRLIPGENTDDCMHHGGELVLSYDVTTRPRRSKHINPYLNLKTKPT